MMMSQIKKDGIFTIIAGPCAIETEEECLLIAETCKRLCDTLGFQYIFKASYTKANRTSYNSFRGIGLDRGLEILDKVKVNLDVPILTDIHEKDEVKPVAQVADVIQIPAFLSRQTGLIEAAAKSGRAVNIKKAQFMSPQGAKHSYDKAVHAGAPHVMLTERGTFFGYNDLVVDFRNFKIIDDWGIPLIYDVTHSLQKPSIGSMSGGTPQFVLSMASAAVATGHLSGLFIETHPEPTRAKSDAQSMLALDQLEKVLTHIRKLLDLS